MIKGLIFDFGGPIAESNTWRTVFSSYDDYYNLPKGTVSQIIHDYFKFAHRGDVKNFEEFFELEKYNSPLDANQLTQILSESDEGLTVSQPMVDLIKKYKADYKIALLSNFTTNLDDVLRKFKINDLFDVVVCSSKIKISKPSPQAFWYTLEKMGLEANETIFIDDSSLNIRGAEEVEIKGILYKDFEQTKKDLESIL